MKIKWKEPFTKDFVLLNVFLFLTVVFTGYALPKIVPTSAQTVKPPTGPPVIVVDAGHGGVDGGAQSSDGTLEKEINLAISLCLRDLLQSAGYEVVMIRETDVSIHDPSAKTIRQKKVSDLHNRQAIANERPNAMYISIHQNFFEQSRYHGAQLFYSKNNEKSAILAEAIDSSIKSKLQPDNTRELKQGGKNLYLLWNLTMPTVLVECGFLSNPAEAAKLKTPDYQKQMAFSIFCGIENYVNAEKGGEGTEFSSSSAA